MTTDLNCGNGSIYNDHDPAHAAPYTPPTICIGDLSYSDGCDALQEQYAAEALNLSGTQLNIFKLLGVHEQGKLVDLTGNGNALNASDDVFNSLSPAWVSQETGIDVLTSPSWIGYDFGTVKTSFGQEMYAPGQPNRIQVHSFKLNQPVAASAASQVRVDRSDGDFFVEPGTVVSSNTSVSIFQFSAGSKTTAGKFMVQFASSGTFIAYFISGTTVFAGTGVPNVPFSSAYGCFTLRITNATQGTLVSFDVQMQWFRVDVVNLPTAADSGLIPIKSAKASRYWRMVPTSFIGATTNASWVVGSLQLFDYEVTDLSNIQDQFLLENRDRDYASTSLPIKASYTPVDAISDFSKFGFQISETYAFTTSFALMVQILGRPIVVGDVIELPSELQYDFNLKPVRKFLEVTDATWSTNGYTTAWRPVIYRFQASELVPSQEHRDIVGTVHTQKYGIDDSDFFSGIQEIQTGPLTSTEHTIADGKTQVPENGSNTREVASGLNRFQNPGTHDADSLYCEDGMPPNGAIYTEGFTLPPIDTAEDGTFFRLIYAATLQIPAKLYKFDGSRRRWIYIETDRREQGQSHKPSQIEIFSDSRTTRIPISGVSKL